MPKPLLIPPAAEADRDSVEVGRLWKTRSGFHVSLLPHAWSDPAAWGIALHDLAAHLARAISQSGGEADAVLERIFEGFDAERAHPTDEPRGGSTE
ncbi:MAG TPA: DUF5076 domain-containing protein [Phycisphaerales bacterium]|nr:DUF5076 domain-containing protein [Phycisphaerales bacterium]